MVSGCMDWDIYVWGLVGAASVDLRGSKPLDLQHREVENLTKETIQLLFKLQGHRGWVTCLVLNKKGTVLFSGAEDGLIIIWDLGKQKALVKMKQHSAKVNCIAVYERRQTIVSGDESGLLLAYDIVREEVR